MAKLYVVPTPIGNLDDITLRALQVLREVPVVLAEDTRKASFLLQHFGIAGKQLLSHHKFNEHKFSENIVQRILAGDNIALVSDAGTPSISDPGFLLVRTCIEAGVEVECLPGAVAFIPALVNSGLPSDRFVFEGFLPQKKGRKKRLAQLADEPRTLIFYESPYRIGRLLNELGENLGIGRKACISRELSKIYEENVRGTLEDLIKWAQEREIKGEIVVVVEGKQKPQPASDDEY